MRKILLMIMPDLINNYSELDRLFQNNNYSYLVYNKDNFYRDLGFGNSKNISMGTYLQDLEMTQARISFASQYFMITKVFDGREKIARTNYAFFPDVASLKPLKDMAKKTISLMEDDKDYIVLDLSGVEKVDSCDNINKIINIIINYAQDNFYTVSILSNYHAKKDTLSFLILDKRINLKNGYVKMVNPTLLKYYDIAIPHGMGNSLF